MANVSIIANEAAFAKSMRTATLIVFCVSKNSFLVNQTGTACPFRISDLMVTRSLPRSLANYVAPRPEGYGLPFGEAKKAGALWLDQGDASRNPVLISWKDKGSDLSYIRDDFVIKDTAANCSYPRIEFVIAYQIGAHEFLLEEFQYFVAVRSA